MDKAFTTNEFLAKKLFLRYLIPSIFSLLASSVNALIDTAIVGNCIKDTGLASMSIVAPVHLLYLTVGSTICVGASVCFSQSLGADKIKQARSYFGFAICAVILVGIIFTAVFTPLSGQIAVILGATGELIEPSKQYLFYYFCGGIFVMAMYIPHSFSKALGKPMVPLILLGIMAVLNVILTYLFVAVFNYGLGGASLATVIAIAVATITGFFFVISKKSSFNPIFFKLKFKQCFRAIISGIASGFNNFIRFLTVFGINIIINSFINASLLSTYSVARSVQDLFNCVALGTSQAIIPIVAMFFMERNNKSVQTVIKLAIKVGLIIVAVCAVLAGIFSGYLSQLFGKTPETQDKLAIIFVVVGLIPTLINCLMASYYTCVKKYGFSYLILALRVVLTLAFALVFALCLSGSMMFLCFFAGESTAFLITTLVVSIYASKKKKYKPFFLLEKKNDNIENKISFSLHPEESEVVATSAKLSEFLEEKEVDMKTAMKASLAIEEILMAIINKKMLPENEYVYVTVFFDIDGAVMRFRYGGKENNPFNSKVELEGDDADFGINVLKKSVNETDYLWSFGLNNLVVLI